jgi:hypothetical protein
MDEHGLDEGVIGRAYLEHHHVAGRQRFMNGLMLWAELIEELKLRCASMTRRVEVPVVATFLVDDPDGVLVWPRVFAQRDKLTLKPRSK